VTCFGADGFDSPHFIDAQQKRIAYPINEGLNVQRPIDWRQNIDFLIATVTKQRQFERFVPRLMAFAIG